MSEQLTLTFAAPRGDGDLGPAPELLLLEQADWPEHTGQVSRGALVAWLAAQFYGVQASGLVDCGFSGGVTGTDILVWPLRAGVTYRLLTTHGEIGPGEWEEIEEEATVQFSLTTEAELPHPSLAVLDTEWLGSWDAAGNPDTAPAVTLTPWSRTARIAAPTYGSLRIRYRAGRWVHRLSVARREEAIENWYSAWIVAYPSGGRPVMLEFEPPPTAEAGGESQCGRTTVGSITADDDDTPAPPQANRVIRTKTYDYCTGVLVNDNSVSV